MNTLLIYVAVATLGWQTGYQRLQEGGMEYIIQLDAPAIDALCRQDDRKLHSLRHRRSSFVPDYHGHGPAAARSASSETRAAEGCRDTHTVAT